MGDDATVSAHVCKFSRRLAGLLPDITPKRVMQIFDFKQDDRKDKVEILHQRFANCLVQPPKKFSRILAMIQSEKRRSRSGTTASNMAETRGSEACSGSRNEETTTEMAQRIVTEDRHVASQEIPHEEGISIGSVHSVLTEFAHAESVGKILPVITPT